jgi:type VI secretion system protein ImpK
MSALNSGRAAPSSSHRSENLALVFQEVLTVIERLRANRQPVTDAESFRTQVKHTLKTAEQEALRRGYTSEDVHLTKFAAVAFLDESILNMSNPAFSDWARRPLQEEFFKIHEAGEIFFRHVNQLLSASDSESNADVLEVHELCLLLGFRGRFGVSGAGEIRAIVEQIEAKIRRIRGSLGPLSPPWDRNTPHSAPKRDKTSKLLFSTAAVTWAIALALFIFFLLMLGSGAQTLQSLAARIQL